MKHPATLAAGVVMAAAWFWMTRMACGQYRDTLGIETREVADGK